MSRSRQNLSSSQAAAHLGVSAKALRLYEQRGLIAPERTSAGWRAYGRADMARAAEIISLRALGLSLTQIARVMKGNRGDLEAGLAAHEVRLQEQASQIASSLKRVQSLQSDIVQGQTPALAELAIAVVGGERLAAGFKLPWPWGGEWFELRDIGMLNFITGPLGSGKTRLAQRLAEQLPDAAFLGLDRLTDGSASRHFAEDAALTKRVERRLEWLAEDGAERSDALQALVTALEAQAPSILVVDMVEQGLNEATQKALIAHLRLVKPAKRALFLMTRSSSILDIDAVKATETVIVCPANHSPPIRVVPYPGGRGYEAVDTCLANPEVRARTANIAR